jgi:hypothetical protein
VREAACWSKKGDKVGLSRFFGAVYKFKYEEVPQWHTRALGCHYWGVVSGKFEASRLAKLWSAHAQVRVDEEEARGTLAAGDDHWKQLRSLCDNRLMLAATMYTDDENFRRMLVICASCTPIEKWHSEQNTRCRSTHGNLEFMKRQVAGSSWEPLLDTMQYIQSYAGLAYMQFILCRSECEPGIDHKDHPAIAFENEMAALALEMALLFIGCRLRRTLWYCRGWPWRFCALGGGVLPDIQATTCAALKRDHENFQEFTQVHGMQHTHLAKRSCFNTVPVQQLVQIMEVSGWRANQQVQEWADRVHAAVLTTQVIEDGFNRAKVPERKGPNRKVHARRLFSTLIEKNVLSEVHHYQDLDYKNQQVPRNTIFPEAAWRHEQQHQSMDLTGIMGVGTTPGWYSPSAQNLPQEHADLAILEMCKLRGDWSLHDQTFWSALLAEQQYMVRNRALNGDWQFSLGIFHSGTAALGWPAEKCVARCASEGSEFFKPSVSTACKELHWLIIANPHEWEARPFTVRAPIWQLMRWPGMKPQAFSHDFIVVEGGPVEPLLHLAAKSAFWSIPKQTLLKFARALSVVCKPEMSLFTVVMTLVMDVLRCSEQEALQYCRTRLAKAQPTGVEELLEIDAVEDLMEAADKKEMKQARRDAELQRTEMHAFEAELKSKADAMRPAAAKAKGRGRGRGAKGQPASQQRRRFVPGELSQAELALLCPPGAYIWKSPFGAWVSYLPPFPRCSRSWQKYGEEKAASLVLQGVWVQYLDLHGLSKEDCPVEGLFN